MPEELPEDEGGQQFQEPPAFFQFEGGPVREPGASGPLIEVRIEGVFSVPQGGQVATFVLLSDGDRKLPIMIGPFEAHAIRFAIEKGLPDRPMTHDLIKTIIDRLNCTVDRVVIDDLWNTVYYAKIYLNTGKEEYEIDSRPSDAIAIAARYDVQIFVADSILESGEDF
jgi:uncharacterized protein